MEGARIVRREGSVNAEAVLTLPRSTGGVHDLEVLSWK